MKLDIYAINKLNPPGLLNLSALFELVRRLIAGLDVYGIANDASVLNALMMGPVDPAIARRV